MTISAIITAFNEEKRIAHALECLMWCDEIILLDKKSKDKTIEIANEFGNKVKILQVENKPYYDPNEWKLLLDNAVSEWICAFTCSDLMHPILAKQILDLIKNKDFDSDIIFVPYKRFILGIENKRSPWHSNHHEVIFRKKSIIIDYQSVHNAAIFEGKKYFIKAQQHNFVYHLTHESANIMMDRHMRYWKGEANATNINLTKDLLEFLKEFFKIFLIKKTFLLGKNGIMLMFAYLSYFMMSYVYKWEKLNSRASLTYSDLRLGISDLWKKENLKK